MSDANTFPKLLDDNAARIGDRPAIREKEFGIWQTWSWAQVRDEVRKIALGFAAAGLKRGDRVAIIGDNRPQLYWGMVAAQALGAIPVPMYQDSGAEELLYVMNHAEVRFAFVEDQEQVDKMMEAKGRCKTLEKIIYKDTRGLRMYDQPYLVSLENLISKGQELAAKKPDFYDSEVAKGKNSDIAIFLYTSGTTGDPKGVLLNFDNLIVSSRNACEFDNLTEKEEVVAYLPMAWVGDNIFSIGESYVAGFCVNCPESAATVLSDLREIGPTYFFAPPVIFQNILTTVMIRMEDAGWLKRKMFHYFMGVAKRVGVQILDGERVSLAARLKYFLGKIFVYGPLKNTLGFSRIRLAYTAGESIGPELFTFFRSLGINMKQLYGSTEATVFITIQRDGEVKSDTVGPPAPGVEVKITKQGEVLYKSPGVFQEYYKNPKATKETKTKDGWVRTGDAGFFGDDGHLRIVDRIKDVGKLKDGTMFAPKYIENRLKFFPYIKEVVTFGDRRDFATAMVSIDIEAVGNWAEKNNLTYASYQELAAHGEVYNLIQGSLEQVNRDLAADPHLAGSQIRRFLLLHKELDADDGELTRTGKVRRRPVAEKYKSIINALYGGKDRIKVEAKVSFDDGRSGTIKANLNIAEAKTFTTQDLAKGVGVAEGEELQAAS